MPVYPQSEAASDELFDYDVISSSAGQGSLDSSIAELDQYLTNSVIGANPYLGATGEVRVNESASARLSGRPAEANFPYEPPPTIEAANLFDTVALTAEDIHTFVKRAVGDGLSPEELGRPVRVYVDGVFDVFHAGTALHLRQAKLSFPSVHLLVGVFSDDQCRLQQQPFGELVPSSNPVLVPHIERCELVRHCRWVDEVITDAPLIISEKFVKSRKIDFVAIEEGSSIDPAINKARLVGYDLVKGLGRAIPTRKCRGLAGPTIAAATFRAPVTVASTPIMPSATLLSTQEDESPPEPKVDF